MQSSEWRDVCRWSFPLWVLIYLLGLSSYFLAASRLLITWVSKSRIYQPSLHFKKDTDSLSFHSFRIFRFFSNSRCLWRIRCFCVSKSERKDFGRRRSLTLNRTRTINSLSLFLRSTERALINSLSLSLSLWSFPIFSFHRIQNRRKCSGSWLPRRCRSHVFDSSLL